MYKNLTREMQNHPERFQFLPAQDRSEFWENMKVVAWCSKSNDTETKNAITLSSLNGIVICYICKSVLKYDWRTPGSSHIKRHVKIVSHVKANTSNNCLLLILIKNTKAKSVLFNLFVIAEPLKHFHVCHGTAINKKLNKHELHVKKQMFYY